MRISEKVNGVTMWNLWHVIFTWKRRYRKIFKFGLVYHYRHMISKEEYRDVGKNWILRGLATSLSQFYASFYKKNCCEISYFLYVSLWKSTATFLENIRYCESYYGFFETSKAVSGRIYHLRYFIKKTKN